MQLARSGCMLENPHSFSPSAVHDLLLLAYLISLSTFCLLEFYSFFFFWSHVKPAFKVIFPLYSFTTVVFHKFYWLCLLIRCYDFTLKFLFYFRVKSVFLYFHLILWNKQHLYGTVSHLWQLWIFPMGLDVFSWMFFFNELYFTFSVS